jgi:hypothetical protein
MKCSGYWPQVIARGHIDEGYKKELALARLQSESSEVRRVNFGSHTNNRHMNSRIFHEIGLGS